VTGTGLSAGGWAGGAFLCEVFFIGNIHSISQRRVKSLATNSVTSARKLTSQNILEQGSRAIPSCASV
jgi:hypothetical protein